MSKIHIDATTSESGYENLLTTADLDMFEKRMVRWFRALALCIATIAALNVGLIVMSL